MRTHRDLIRASGGVALFAKKLSLANATVRSWYTRNSIPRDYWIQISLLELAPVAELLACAPQTKRQHKAA
jgi:hypothetical protein